MRPRGRPPGTTKDDSLAGVVRVRCDLAEKGRWVKAAKGRGITLSEWIRRIANKEAGATPCPKCDGTGLEKADYSNGRQSTGEPCPDCPLGNNVRQAINRGVNIKLDKDGYVHITRDTEGANE